jgi:NitT/TauT family transport system permease protein
MQGAGSIATAAVAEAPAAKAVRRYPTRSQLFTLKAPISQRAALSGSVSVWLALAGTWAFVTYGQLVSPIFLPTPGAVLARGISMLRDGSLAVNVWASAEVILAGFALSALVALPLGIVMGAWAIAASIFEPVINFVRYLPVTAFMPLFVLWIGIGLEERIAIILFGTFFSQAVMIANSIRVVPQELLNAAYTLGASRSQVLWRVMLPAATPGIFDTLRVTIGWAWTYVVAAELIAASSGLGYMSMKAARGFQVDVIFLAIGTIGLLGLVTDQAFRLLSVRFAGWAQ